MVDHRLQLFLDVEVFEEEEEELKSFLKVWKSEAWKLGRKQGGSIFMLHTKGANGGEKSAV